MGISEDSFASTIDELEVSVWVARQLLRPPSALLILLVYKK